MSLFCFYYQIIYSLKRKSDFLLPLHPLSDSTLRNVFCICSKILLLVNFFQICDNLKFCWFTHIFIILTQLIFGLKLISNMLDLWIVNSVDSCKFKVFLFQLFMLVLKLWLTLVSWTLMNTHLSYSGCFICFIHFIRFSKLTIVSSSNRDSFTYSFISFMAFLLALIQMVKISLKSIIWIEWWEYVSLLCSLS